MAIVSTKLAAGQTTSVNDVNNLREDLLANHDHDGTKGAAVDHKNLGETGAMAGKDCTHTQLDTHVVGSGSFDDSPGGDLGVHGLNAAVYVAGSGQTQQLVIQGGKVALTDLIESLSGAGLYGKHVTFAPAFTSIVAIVATYVDKQYKVDGSTVRADALYARCTDGTGCDIVSSDLEELWYKGGSTRYAYWMAIGTIAK